MHRAEEAMCIVAYLQDEATIPKLELQAAVYGVRLRKQIINEHDDKLTKSFIRPIHQRSYSGYKQRTKITNVRCEQSSGDTRKVIDGSMATERNPRILPI